MIARLSGIGALSLVMALIAPQLLAAAPLRCALDQALITGAKGQVETYRIELATTVENRMRGLMYRESMPEDAGMLFVYPQEAPRAFWMRNTLIPLDMIFIAADGEVVSVHENAVPHDETPVHSEGDARFVLELNGGQARAHDIVAGSVLSHPMIAQDIARAPCAQ